MYFGSCGVCGRHANGEDVVLLPGVERVRHTAGYRHCGSGGHARTKLVRRAIRQRKDCVRALIVQADRVGREPVHPLVGVGDGNDLTVAEAIESE